LTPHVDSAANWWKAANTWLSIAISYAGLEALGVPQDSLQSFPEAFRVGMAARSRELTRIIQPIGDFSAPQAGPA
jgi:hypothetical protein